MKNAEHGNVNIRAHILSFELAGLGTGHEMLHHECGNRGCVNPRHLRPMTRSDHSSFHQGKRCQRGHLRSCNTYVSPRGKRGCRVCRNTRR